jgi:hypothetical protein
MPGKELWSRDFVRGEFEETLYLDLDPNYEHWFDPTGVHDPCGDQQIWQYDFYIDEVEAFTQEGDPCEPKIYWLDVYVELTTALPGDEFGWKTSIDHWNDCAVYWDTEWNQWTPLWYPDGHPLHGAQVDMAFSITQPEVSEDDLDFGDAPDPCYPTLLANDGARHIIGGPYFCDPAGGDAPDPEPDGQPDPWATGDDFDADGDDEDGVSFPLLVQGQPDMVFLDVCGGGGIVQIWIDWDASGSWEATEQIHNAWLFDGPHGIPVTPAAGSVAGLTFARCRISSVGGLSPTGQADDGEVEDHMVEIEQVLTCWDNITQCAGQSSGDGTCNGFVNLGDLFALKAYFGKCAPWTAPECCSDYNQSGCINLADLFILKAGFGTGPHVPSTLNQNCP